MEEIKTFWKRFRISSRQLGDRYTNPLKTNYILIKVTFNSGSVKEGIYQIFGRDKCEDFLRSFSSFEEIEKVLKPYKGVFGTDFVITDLFCYELTEEGVDNKTPGEFGPGAMMEHFSSTFPLSCNERELEERAKK